MSFKTLFLTQIYLTIKTKRKSLKTNINMQKQENKQIEQWNKLTDEITKQFLLDYFEDDDPEYWWVANEIGGIFNYADFYLNFSDILTCYKLGITTEQLINWHDYCLENDKVNIKLAQYLENYENN